MAGWIVEQFGILMANKGCQLSRPGITQRLETWPARRWLAIALVAALAWASLLAMVTHGLAPRGGGSCG